MRARGLAALAVTVATGGCIKSDDLLQPDPDVVSIAIILFAGESEAFMLAGHPHLPQSDTPPEVRATLLGPGWEATFSDTTDLDEGCGGGPTFWEMPMVCLRAPLPEPIREQTSYGLEGESPRGPFTGATVTPTPPAILAPAADTFRLLPTMIPDYWWMPVGYGTPDDVGTLRTAALGVFSDSSGTYTGRVLVQPWDLDIDRSTDSLAIDNVDQRMLRGRMYLLGIGWNYTRFVSDGARVHGYGIEGDGVYGYFDGAVKSRPVHVLPPDSVNLRSNPG